MPKEHPQLFQLLVMYVLVAEITSVPAVLSVFGPVSGSTMALRSCFQSLLSLKYLESVGQLCLRSGYSWSGTCYQLGPST